MAFVSNIYLGIFNRNNNKFCKEVVKFCFELLKVTAEDESIEVLLTLLTTVLLKVNIEENLITSFVNKLVDKTVSVSNHSCTNIYYFILFVWQKFPQLFVPELIDQMIESPLSKHLSKPKSGNCAVYVSLNQAFFAGVDCVQILK